jgi:hypothetical protein
MMKQMRGVAKQEAKKAVKGHEATMHKAKKMKAGGPTSMDMKKYGRGMAKVMNQRSPVRKVRATGI